MSLSKSVKLNSELWQRTERYAKKAGYSSPEEFLEHLLEKELSRVEEDQAREEVGKRLKGLGYLE